MSVPVPASVLSEGAGRSAGGQGEESINWGFTPRRAFSSGQSGKPPGLKRVLGCPAWSWDGLEPNLFLWLPTREVSPAGLPVGRWPRIGQEMPGEGLRPAAWLPDGLVLETSLGFAVSMFGPTRASSGPALPGMRLTEREGSVDSRFCFDFCFGV